MIIIAGTIDFDSRESRDGAVEAGLALQQGTRDGEAGCEAYVFAADPCVDTRVVVYERWRDEASLAAHFDHPNYHGMLALLGRFGIAAADVEKHRCDLAEPVYDDTRTPRADFFTG
jgi:quinol monooxygenase YgiN